MTSARSYRDAMPSTIARARLVESAGSQFDPVVVNAFVAVLSRISTDPFGEDPVTVRIAPRAGRLGISKLFVARRCRVSRDGVEPVFRTELLHDIVRVYLGGARSNDELVRNLTVRPSERH